MILRLRKVSTLIISVDNKIGQNFHVSIKIMKPISLMASVFSRKKEEIHNVKRWNKND